MWARNTETGLLMPSVWIYVFRDSRYERGVKIGYHNTSKAQGAWVVAPSYSPAQMLYVAAWQVEHPYVSTSGGLHTSKESLERHLQRLCGRPLGIPRCGEDWIDTTEHNAVTVISRELGHEPDV